MPRLHSQVVFSNSFKKARKLKRLGRASWRAEEGRGEGIHLPLQDAGCQGHFGDRQGRHQQEARVSGHSWPPSLPRERLWGGPGLLRLEVEA